MSSAHFDMIMNEMNFKSIVNIILDKNLCEILKMHVRYF